MKYIAVLLIALLVVAGCSRPPKQMADVENLMEKAREMLTEGQTNEAIASLSKAMNDAEYKSFRTQIYCNMLNIMLAAGKAEEARTQYLGYIGKDNDIVRTGFYMLGDSAKASGEDMFQGWISKLMEQPELPRELKEQVFMWQLGIYQAKGQVDRGFGLAGYRVGNAHLEPARAACSTPQGRFARGRLAALA